MGPIIESCTTCSNARTVGQHTVCSLANVGAPTEHPERRCVCANAADESRPADCPGWAPIERSLPHCETCSAL